MNWIGSKTRSMKRLTSDLYGSIIFSAIYLSIYFGARYGKQNIKSNALARIVTDLLGNQLARFEQRAGYAIACIQLTLLKILLSCFVLWRYFGTGLIVRVRARIRLDEPSNFGAEVTSG